jgi:DHA1 family tetracycline resistance protein-like MFS transporter
VTPTRPAPGSGGRAAVAAAMACGYTVQQTIAPVLLPLAEQLGVDDLWMGVVITVSGCVFLLSNPLWAVASRRWGSRGVLLLGLVGITLSSLAFAGVVRWAPDSPALGATLAALTRGVVFGLAVAAVEVAGPACLLTGTTASPQRLRAAAVVAGSQGFGFLAGPLLGASTNSSGLTVLLLAPVAPLIVVIMLVVRAAPQGRPVRRAAAAGSALPFVRRAWPCLLVVVSLLLLVACVQVITGSLLKERIGLTTDQAGRMAGWFLVASSVPFLLAQAAATVWPRQQTARMVGGGLLLTVVGLLPMTIGQSSAWLLAGYVTTSAGIGLALPSCYEYVSRADTRQDGIQAGSAIAGAAGVAFAIGPLIAVTLYAADSTAPFLAATALLLLSGACLLLYRPATGRHRRSVRTDPWEAAPAPAATPWDDTPALAPHLEER